MESSRAPTRLRSLPSWLLNQAALPSHRLVARSLEEVGAHRSHFSLLAALDEFGPDSQAGLGRRIGMDRSDVVALLNELDAGGLVRRAPDPADRRRNVVSITAAGRRRLAALDRRIAAVQDEILAPLTAAERTELVALLTRIVEHHASAGAEP